MKKSFRSSGLLDRTIDKPLIALQAAINGDSLIKAAFALLQRAVTCDMAGVHLRIENLPAGLISFRFLDTRGRDFAREMREGVFFQDHPAGPILMANPGIRLIGTRETLPPDEVLHASRFYREVMQVMGFRHAIAMYFWDDPPQMPEAVLSVCRVEGKPDFTDDDVAVLDRLHPAYRCSFAACPRDREGARRARRTPFPHRPGAARVCAALGSHRGGGKSRSPGAVRAME